MLTTDESTRAPREDVYTRVTTKIVAALEQGVRPWVKPWSAEHTAGRITRPLRHNGQAYRGINVLMLWGDSVEKGFVSPFWLTYKQTVEMKAHVRKGQHGSNVIYADRFTKTGTDGKGQEIEEKIPFMKAYTVFNAEQVEGLPAQYYATAEPRLDTVQRIDRAEAFFAATGANIQHGGNQAFYTMAQDRVQMPPFESFQDAESYYGTLCHEMTHWTRHPNRLKRDFGRKRWGDEGYAMEELVAELGSAFLSADLDLTPEVRADHASYIANWLTVLKDDKRAVFQAAAHAQKASDFLCALQVAAVRAA